MMTIEDHAGQPTSALMPSRVRRWLGVALAVVLGAAIYLVAVRGEALLVDLATASAGIFCF
jgi:hypothetical protein